MSFKVAFIGAGSLVFARTLFTDIMSVPEFHNIEVAFTDINPDNLEKTRELCQRDLDANGIPVKIYATTDRREAFRDAKYIVNCVRIGGLEAFETDIEIPLKYGVDQCVGGYTLYRRDYVRTASDRPDAGVLQRHPGSSAAGSHYAELFQSQRNGNLGVQ